MVSECRAHRGTRPWWACPIEMCDAAQVTVGACPRHMRFPKLHRLAEHSNLQALNISQMAPAASPYGPAPRTTTSQPVVPPITAGHAWTTRSSGRVLICLLFKIRLRTHVWSLAGLSGRVCPWQVLIFAEKARPGQESQALEKRKQSLPHGEGCRSESLGLRKC